MKEAVYHRTYEEVPHQTLIECKAVAKQSLGREYLKFKISVLDENQRRLMIGKSGKNLEEIKKLFLVQYCKNKATNVDVEFQVAVMNEYQKSIEKAEEPVFAEKHHLNEARQEVSELEERTKRKLGIKQ